MIGVGIIGTGMIAREHAQAITLASESLSLVAAAEVVPERLKSFCSAFPVLRAYESAAALIADPDVDLVAIATPPAAHEALAVAALDEGKYVFCEKPLGHSLASGVRIAESEARHPGRLAVGFQLRYETSFRRLVWLCQNNWIGDIQSVLIERHSYIPLSDQGAGGGWWGSWNVAGGGVLMTQLIHELDLLLLIMGRPLSVKTEMDTRFSGIESEDFVDATIRFAGGRTARCCASVNSGHLAGQFTVKGSDGTVSLPWNLTMTNSTRLSAALKAVNAVLPVPRPPSPSIVTSQLRSLARRLGAKAKPELTPHARFYLDIARNIQSGAPLPVPAAEGLKSLELCMAAYESALAGEEIELPLTPKSAVYNGVSQRAFDARKCARILPHRTFQQLVKA